MKLSEEGFANLSYHEALGLSVYDYDFQPNDFTDCVVLTVQEAEIIRDHLLREKEFLLGKYGTMLAQYSQIWAELLEHKIKQVTK